MPVNDVTTNRSYQKPNIANTLSDDVGRLRSALDAIDTDMASKAPTAGPTFTGVVAIAGGSAAAPSLAFTGDTNTGLYSPGADQLAISTGGTEVARIDSSGRLLVGTSTALANVYITASVVTPQIQLEGNSGSTSSLSITRQTGAAANLVLQRGVTGTPVAINHTVGQINFNGFDGTNFLNTAQIKSEVDGTPGANDMPGRLVFLTTADGAAVPTEQLRISSAGTVIYNQPAPAAVDTSATLTVANLTAKIITSTTAAAVTMTLPTGTNMDAGFSGLYNNMAFEWTVINTGGTNAVTMQGNTAHTVVGSGTVAANGSGRFLSRRTAGTTWVTYRLAT